jgi:hypothetical protein
MGDDENDWRSHLTVALEATSPASEKLGTSAQSIASPAGYVECTCALKGTAILTMNSVRWFATRRTRMAARNGRCRAPNSPQDCQKFPQTKRRF